LQPLAPLYSQPFGALPLSQSLSWRFMKGDNINKPLYTQPDNPIEVVWPPCIARLRSGTYAVSGSDWLLIPPDTSFDDLPRYMVVKARERAQRSPEDEDIESWSVIGSKGDEYTVTKSVSGSRQIFFSCTCAGYGWRGKCKHIEGIKNKHV